MVKLSIYNPSLYSRTGMVAGIAMPCTELIITNNNQKGIYETEKNYFPDGGHQLQADNRFFLSSD